MKEREETDKPLLALEDETVNGVCELLRNHEFRIQDYLAEFISAMCDVSMQEMFSNSSSTRKLQPRWLFWYAYRYMTNETYDKIGEVTRRYSNHRFTTNSIGQCINKMAATIESEPIWKKRWTIIKRIIKLRDADVKKSSDSTITITVPKELKDIINIEIKEK